MSKANTFKTPERSGRTLQVDETFTRGINFTKNVLNPGQQRMLFNFRLKDFGRTIGPRRGLVPLEPPSLVATTGGMSDADPHVVYNGVYEDAMGVEHFADIAISFGWSTAHDYFLPHYAWGSRFINSTSRQTLAPIGWSNQATVKAERFQTTIHKLSLIAHLRPIHAIAEGRLYIFVDNKLTRVKVGLDYIQPVEVVPAIPRIAEATTVGFNMLLDQPYVFENHAMGTLQPKGILPYNVAETKLLLSAFTGETIRFKLVYDYVEDTDYRVKWQMRARGSDEWTTLHDYGDAVYAGGDDITLNITPNDNSFILRLYIAEDDGEGGIVQITEETINYPLYEMNNSYLRNIAANNYNLNTAKGMVSYSNLLGLYGVTGAENVLFFSDYKNYSYFPFPHNILTFSEKISVVVPYLNSLVVITDSAVYLVTGGPFPAQMRIDTIQANLGITGFDKYSFHTYKNLLYFRHAGRYYVMQPNVLTDRVDDLQVKTMDDSIAELLDNFGPYLRTELLPKVYGIEPDTLVLRDNRTFVDDNKIKLLFKCSTVQYSNFFIDVILCLDLTTGGWTIECYQANRATIPFKSSLVNSIQFYSSYVEAPNNRYLEVYSYSETSFEDQLTLMGPKLIFNYQYLDSGSRNQNLHYLKRYREIQYQITNSQGHPLEFYSEFFIDGKNRQGYKEYSVVQDTDPESPNYGEITYTPTIEPTFNVVGETALGVWQLDAGAFPKLDKVKARFKVSGKGRYPALELISFNEKDYELVSYGWVYRIQTAR